MSKFIFQQSKLISLNIPLFKIEKEIKNNYSFYWYHYLNTQLQYIKFWQEQFKDLEMLLIGLQTLIQTVRCLKTTEKFQTLNSFILTKISRNREESVYSNIKNANISATSISEVTGIPRANCIRKLEKYVKMKVLEKDPLTKRYYLVPTQLSIVSTSSSSNILLDGIKNTTSIFSEFSSILLKSLAK